MSITINATVTVYINLGASNASLDSLKESIMATLQEVKDAIAQVVTAIATEKSEVDTKLAALAEQIATLQAQIAAGTAATPAQLDELLADIGAVRGLVSDITTPTLPA